MFHQFKGSPIQREPGFSQSVSELGLVRLPRPANAGTGVVVVGTVWELRSGFYLGFQLDVYLQP